jgi:predicted nucleic acid-binding protein
MNIQVKRNYDMKYRGAISDTDILINLAKGDCINLLELLFDEIVVPQFILDVELRKKAGVNYSKIVQIINDDNSIFKVVDRRNDRLVNNIAEEVIQEKKKLIGPGESECAGYATALGIPIIISDNYTEFKWLEEDYITLTHCNILTLCEYFDYISKESAANTFNNINSTLTRPTTLSYESLYYKSIRKFKENGWCDYLGIIE